jgi:hypothetical protein
VQAMPNLPAPPAENPKRIAARLLAEWLAFPPRAMRERIYLHCGLRDPDTLYDEW